MTTAQRQIAHNGRTDRRTDKGTDRGTLDGQFLISFCVVHEKMTTLKHKTFQFVLKMKLAIYFLHFVVLPRLVSFHLACSCLVARFTPLTLSEMKGNVALSDNKLIEQQ